MKRAIVLASALIFAAACNGMRNDTSLAACKYLVKALHEGDREAVTNINHSESWNFPTNHLMKVAPIFQDADLQQMQYEQKNDRTVIVRFRDKAGKEREHEFYFLREKEGYFFISMS